MKAFRAVSVATALVTYALVVLGGVVRVSGSGLGCPDWPLCHGRLLPPLDVHAIIEYSHRTTASLTSALVVLTAVVAWVAWRKRRDIVIPATVALVLLMVQVVLGAITVRLELPPMIVLAHLATAMALLAAVCVTAVAACLPQNVSNARIALKRGSRGATPRPLARRAAPRRGRRHLPPDPQRLTGGGQRRERQLQCLAPLRRRLQPCLRRVSGDSTSPPRPGRRGRAADHRQPAGPGEPVPRRAPGPSHGCAEIGRASCR